MKTIWTWWKRCAVNITMLTTIWFHHAASIIGQLCTTAFSFPGLKIMLSFVLGKLPQRHRKKHNSGGVCFFLRGRIWWNHISKVEYSALCLHPTGAVFSESGKQNQVAGGGLISSAWQLNCYGFIGNDVIKQHRGMVLVMNKISRLYLFPNPRS